MDFGVNLPFATENALAILMSALVFNLVFCKESLLNRTPEDESYISGFTDRPT